METDSEDRAGQKATVLGSGASVNISGQSGKPRSPMIAYILIGLEILSIALLIYFAFTSHARGY